MIAVVLTALSCKKDDEGKSSDYPTPKAGATYVLEGTVNTPGFTWSTNSSIGLYSATEGVKAVNKECLIQGWANINAKDEDGNPIPYDPSPFEGQANGKFDTPALDLKAGENSFIAYTPYDPELVYLNNIIYALEIGQKQVMPTADVASSCFAYGKFTGIPGVDDSFKFTLNPITALVKIAITSSEFAGMSVSKIEFADLSNTAALGGGFNVNTESKQFNKLETFSKVTVTVTKPTPIVSGKAQNFYVQALPGDYSSNDMWAVIYLEDADKTVTIPVQLSGVVLEAGQTKEIKIDNLSTETNKFKWYCAVESRKQPALGYCYGDANTYLIQCKNGHTWTGATYTPDASIPDEVTIDFRARGNFSNAIDPTGAEFEWFKNGSTVYAPLTANYTNVIDATAYTFTVDAANYTVKVKNTGAYAGAPILLMKKNGKILWAWSFWNISADGTKLEAINAGEYKLANMDIGQNTTQFAAWAANGRTSDTDPDVIYRFAHHYQWGRFIPVFWSYWPTHTFNGAAGNVPVVEGPLTFANAMANPVGLVLKNGTGTENRISDWAEENDRYGDLWGGGLNKDSRTEEGSKTIYDPCPKGWRVPDPRVFDYIAEQPATVDNTLAGAVICKMANAGDNSFIMNGYYEDYIATNGRIATMGGPRAGKQTTQGAIWSNWVGWHSGVQPVLLTYGTNLTNNISVSTRNRGIGADVRCQKDDKNR